MTSSKRRLPDSSSSSKSGCAACPKSSPTTPQMSIRMPVRVWRAWRCADSEKAEKRSSRKSKSSPVSRNARTSAFVMPSAVAIRVVRAWIVPDRSERTSSASWFWGTDRAAAACEMSTVSDRISSRLRPAARPGPTATWKVSRSSSKVATVRRLSCRSAATCSRAMPRAKSSSVAWLTDSPNGSRTSDRAVTRPAMPSTEDSIVSLNRRPAPTRSLNASVPRRRSSKNASAPTSRRRVKKRLLP